MRHPVIQRPCPHCGSGCVHGHGSFGLMDGARQQRYRCRSCGRTFNQDTDTPLSYLKKRDRWEQLAEGMAQGLSIRSLAAALNIAVATAFRWRHRLLGALCRRPQPVLTGQAAASEAYVPYSEKGSRQTDGRGAYGVRRARAAGAGFGRRRFRRFINGKPSCVLLACAGEQRVVAIVSSGQPAPEQLQSTLAQTLGAGAELSTLGLAPYAAACLRLGVPHREAWGPGAAAGWTPPCRAVERLLRGLYAWLLQFHGVATRYLHHYLAWYRLPGRTARQLLVESNTLRPRRVG